MKQVGIIATMEIPFNKPYMTGKELFYISQAHFNGVLAGDGPYTRMCHAWLERHSGCARALLTHSCTAALELASLLLNLAPGDEVIMPSYTFVSTANAFALRGAIPVFVDIRADTLNIDEALVEASITERTKAIVPVHYAGVSCEMATIMALARKYNLYVIEDAAQAIMSSYFGKPLGSIGDLGAFSFHETKTLISGEGGALAINDAGFTARAEIIREKGTDRSRFFRGEIEKYTWKEIGSSFLPGELAASFLWAQFEEAEHITSERLRLWNQYHSLLEELELEGLINRPGVPAGCQHNGHMYYVILKSGIDRMFVLDFLKSRGVNAVFHYVPLHDSPVGKSIGRSLGNLTVTSDSAANIIRLPLWIGLKNAEQEYVVTLLKSAIQGGGPGNQRFSASKTPAR
jgi:dTDP-4-amino-4,6-dideoxygalactose transaminase